MIKLFVNHITKSVHEVCLSAERFVNVALDVPLPQTFSYEIPDGLRGQVRVGQLLHVPWRKQSKVGVAMSLSAEPPPNVKQFKKVEDIVDPTPVVDEGMIKVLTFISTYYRSPIGDVVNLAVPAGLRRDGQRVFSLTEAGRRAALGEMEGASGDGEGGGKSAKSKRTPLQKALVVLMGEPEGALVRDALMKKVKGLTQKMLDEALAEGFVEFEHALEAASVQAQTVEWLRLTGLPGAKVRLGAVQQQIIEILSDCEELDFPTLRERVPSARQSLKALVQRGLVEIEEREVFRDPFGGEPMPQASKHPLTDEQRAAVDAVLAGPPSGGAGRVPGVFCCTGSRGAAKRRCMST